jgi:hypothetical protein
LTEMTGTCATSQIRQEHRYCVNMRSFSYAFIGMADGRFSMNNNDDDDDDDVVNLSETRR